MSEHEAGPPTVKPVSSQSLEQETDRAIIDAEFSAFYRADIEKLVGFLVLHGGTVADAADVAQETMIKARQRWGTIRSPRAWCRKTAAQALFRKLLKSDREEPTAEVCEPSPLLRPGDVEVWEQQQVVVRVLSTLPTRQRQVMAWTIDGFTPTEIARELGISPEAVRGSLKVARRALAPRITEIERTEK